MFYRLQKVNHQFAVLHIPIRHRCAGYLVDSHRGRHNDSHLARRALHYVHLYFRAN